ncbi:MAG: hypothetical protein IID35_01125 [Planctomycetes bacterium]|nr:hypothetical protein [Planctomycetota bacterium]
MDDQQRKKILVGVLAIGALGAGSWFVLLRKPPQSNEVIAGPATTGRKARKTVVKKTTGRKDRVKKTRKSHDELSMGRKERKAPDRKASGGRKKRGRGAKQLKKKKIQPAA